MDKNLNVRPLNLGTFEISRLSFFSCTDKKASFKCFKLIKTPVIDGRHLGTLSKNFVNLFATHKKLCEDLTAIWTENKQPCMNVTQNQ